MDRSLAARLGRETLAILEAGSYTSPSCSRVDLTGTLQAAKVGSRSYPPGRQPSGFDRPKFATRFEVVKESTLSAARRLVEGGARVAALNFASAKNPGGGFLSGARAQEESLARASGLFACLDGNPMYGFHRQGSDPLYTNYAIYSPDVPVFRDDDGALLERPFEVSFITCPAPNAKVVLERRPERRAEVSEALQERIGKVLAIAAAHGHEAQVLGAWGCGVFGNRPAEVASLFREAFETGYFGVFRHVVFAILDWSEERRFIGPFQQEFAQPIVASLVGTRDVSPHDP